MSLFAPSRRPVALRGAMLTATCVLAFVLTSVPAVCLGTPHVTRPSAPMCLAAGPPEDVEVAVDVVYMVDVSGSIIGLGRTRGDLLPVLIEALVDEVYRTKGGTSLTIATFGDGLHDVDGPGGAYEKLRRFHIDPTDLAGSRQRIVDYIRGLNVAVRREGGHSDRTAIYDSVREVIMKLDQLKAEWEDRNPGRSYTDYRIQKVVIFTDGLDNASDIWSREDFEEALDTRSDHLFAKFVTAPGLDFPEHEGAPVETGFDSRSVEVIPLPRFLDFGNVRTLDAGESVSASMKLVAQRPIPSSRIDFSYAFRGVPEGALEVTLNPDVIDGDPTQVVVHVLLTVIDKEALDRAALASGRTLFTGTLDLKGADPQVCFLPPKTNLSFSYEPTGQVDVRPASRDPGLFEGVRRPAGTDEPATVSYLLTFDQDARETGLTLTARFEWDSGNPADVEALAARHGAPLITFDWRPGGPEAPRPGPVTIGPGVECLTVALTLPKELEPDLPAGIYGGRLVLEAHGGGTLRYSGGGAEAVAGSGTSRLELPVQARVPRPPLPAWVWLLAALLVAALGLVVYRRTLPRFAPGQELHVTYPDGRTVRYELDVYERREPCRAAYVPLGSRHCELDLRLEDHLGVLRAARGGRAIFEPCPYTVEKFAAAPGHFTVRGEPLSEARPVVVEHGDIIRFGDTQLVCALSLHEDDTTAASLDVQGRSVRWD